MKHLPAVVILLGAYNGERYMHAQIQSLIEQDYPAWQLMVRDDGSSDQTQAMLDAWEQKDARIRVLHDQRGNLGAAANFAELMTQAQSVAYDFVLFADQDDVWKKNKITLLVEKAVALGKSPHGASPILVHTDLEVVDENLQCMHQSFMGYQKITHEYEDPLKVLAVQNFVTGCTMLVNRALLDIALPIPQEVIMHDWWLAICAAVFGRLEFIPESTIYYRQHAWNEVGAKGFWSIFNPLEHGKKERWELGSKHFLCSIKQMTALKQRIDERNVAVDAEISDFLERYLAVFRLDSAFLRLYEIRKLGVKRQNLLTNWLLNIRFVASGLKH